MANIPVFGLGGQIEQQRIIDATDAEALLIRQDGDGGDVFAVNTSDPGIDFGQASTDIRQGGTDRMQITAFGINGIQNTSSFALFSDRAASAIVPTLCPNRLDSDTGVGWGGADVLALPVGGVAGLVLTESTGVLMTNQVNAGLTADTGSAQGGTPLTSSVNEISTCATGGDSVTLPTAVAGHVVTIINNGAAACDVFPASGDNLGAGVDTAASLAVGANITYRAYDDTNWFAVT